MIVIGLLARQNNLSKGGNPVSPPPPAKGNKILLCFLVELPDMNPYMYLQ